jgi:hypothetical protein
MPAPQPVAAPPATVAPPPPEPEPEPELETEDGETDESKIPVSEQVTEPPSQEELDAMLGDETELVAVESFVDGEDEEDSEAVDPDDLPEPETLPSSLVSPEEKMTDDVKAGRGKLVALGAAGFLIAMVAGLYFGRGQIVAFLPMAESLYGMVGLSGEILGAGLKIKNVRSERETKDDNEILIIRGLVANISDQVRDIPMILVTLFDESGAELQSVIVAPRKKQVPPNDQVSFKARIFNPPPPARNIDVTFSPEGVEPQQ